MWSKHGCLCHKNSVSYQIILLGGTGQSYPEVEPLEIYKIITASLNVAKCAAAENTEYNTDQQLFIYLKSDFIMANKHIWCPIEKKAN